MTKVQYFTACTLDGYIADENNSLDWLFEVPHDACTLDGYIADENNSLDWLFEVPHDEEDEYWDEWFPSVGGLVMGATTYEWMLAHEGPDSWRRY